MWQTASARSDPACLSLRVREAVAAAGLLRRVRAVVGILRCRLDCIYEFTN